jgi:outer membrane protein assembly factor BamB
LVAAAGLHSINIKTGEGWDYNTPTGKNLNVTPTSGEIAGAVVGGIIGGLIGGLIAGAITGGFYVTYPIYNYNALKTGSDVISGIASNVLINNDFIYFASKDTLTKLNKHTGQPTWKCTFEKDITSNSFIFLNGNELYMINNGFAFRGQSQIDYGKPFIAAFNATTGKQKYLQLLNKNDGPVIDFKLIDNEIYLLFKNAIGKYDLESGKQILETTFSKAVIGDLEYFAGNQYFIANRDDSFLFIDQYDLSTIQIYTTTRKIITLDEQFNVMHTINYENIGVYYEQYKDYYLIENDKKTFLVNTDGERVAEFEATANAFIMDNILYDKQFRSIIAIDLQNIITK